MTRTSSPLELPAFDASEAARLRAEIDEMAAAYVRVLLDTLPAGAVTDVYAKGSAYKHWDSRIDYVPVVSDVDLHVRFRGDDDAATHLGSLAQALDLAQRALALFVARVPDATHVPRPQLTVLNALEREPGFLPSPAATQHTLHGAPRTAATREDYADSAPGDARSFARDLRFVRDELPGKVIDRPGAHAWRAVSTLAWRVAPSGPRLLTQLGMHPYDAWSLNRTHVVRELAARGQPELARAYADFYLAGWDGVRSGFDDGDAALRALRAVDRLFERGAEVTGAGGG